MELAPTLFDGGVDWEGTYVDEPAPNILTDLPPGVLNYPDYLASGNDRTARRRRTSRGAAILRTSSTARPITSCGPAITARTGKSRCASGRNGSIPTYNTYGSGLSTYNYVQRLSFSNVGDNMADFATTGLIQRPLITVQGTLDALLPIDHHGRAYARAVEAGFEAQPVFPNRPTPAYRLYEVQNGNHIEYYKTFYPQLEYILPHAQRAFDLLVANVEQRATLPPDQCIPRGGAIAPAPAQPGHCAELFDP